MTLLAVIMVKIMMEMMKIMSMSTVMLMTFLSSCWDDYSEEDQATLEPALRYWTVCMCSL